MKRLWIGIGILVILLSMGIGLLLGSMVFFEEFSQNMEQAGELAMTGNWTAAVKKAEESEARWKTYRRFWASLRRRHCFRTSINTTKTPTRWCS